MASPPGREANKEYLADGFAPHIKGRAHVEPGDSDYDHGASATLEYALTGRSVRDPASPVPTPDGWRGVRVIG
ncbi:hypothetical protein [Streptomyces atroolivaceus]|uniref:hypothetical protein n=1 Tax=Streptomyces atroolivaceus TaxID=66869 RepID=UPI0036AED486